MILLDCRKKSVCTHCVRDIELNSGTHISTDLEIDSVAVLDLIMEVEDLYSISIPMNSIANIQTIGDLVQTIHDLGGGK